MIKHCLNTVKHCLPVEKDMGNACRKNQKKTSRFFLANFFRGLSFYGADCNMLLRGKGYILFFVEIGPVNCPMRDFWKAFSSVFIGCLKTNNPEEKLSANRKQGEPLGQFTKHISINIFERK